MKSKVLFKKILIYVTGTLVFLLLIFYGLSFFISNEYSAEGNAIINRPKNEIFEYVKYLKNQENYSTWFRSENDIHKTYKGIDGTVGFTLDWKGNETGQGKLIMTKITANEIEYDLVTNGNQISKVYLTLDQQNSDQTSVTWKIEGKLPYPINLLSKVLNINHDFQEGVENLKIILEN